MTHNQYPTTPEKETFAHPERVQFSDGEIALGFSTKGDKLVLGYGSTHKYARSFDTTDMAWIKTKSGNHYALAGGYVINQRSRGAWYLPADDLQVTIGEPLEIPGVGTTTDVESVLLRYKVDSPDSSMADQQVNATSPFQALDAQVEALDAVRPQQA